jgi:glutamate-1-semialdehyde 2,1-aminomutase
MLHEVEEDVGARVCSTTETDAIRFTSSGTLASFYAVLLARAFTGRDRVVKAAGGWHGGQPFALKGVASRDGSFEHLESEGLSAGAADEIVLTQFNDPEDLHAVFRRHAGRIAAVLVEPVLGAGGGIAASLEYLREVRRLTELHGALLICDEIITAFRFTPRDLSASYGVRPDLLVLGKVLGGGMPVAAVAGRREVLELCSRGSGRVKFEGGTYSAHELSLVAARTMLTEIDVHAAQIYPQLAARADSLRRGLAAIGRRLSVPLTILGAPQPPLPAGSLVMPHLLCDDGPPPRSPQELTERQLPGVDERLLRSVLLLHDLSTRTGLGGVSLAHDDDDVARTLAAFEAGLGRLRGAGLLG